MISGRDVVKQSCHFHASVAAHGNELCGGKRARTRRRKYPTQRELPPVSAGDLLQAKRDQREVEMSGDAAPTPDEESAEELDARYKPPPEKTIEEIVAADQDDESLRKYKEALLGEAKAAKIVVEAADPRKVLVKRLALCVTERPDVELDLTADLDKLKKQVFVIKEGVSYRIRIDFIVQREIVHGLKYVQKTYRVGVPVDKMTHMVGSYAPKTELQSYTTPPEDAPSGLMARGSYTVHSLFTDDDKHEHLKWEWSFEIKKDWKD